MNGDGSADVIVADHESGDVAGALGRGDGSFRPSFIGMTGTGRSNGLKLNAIAAADMDGDGRLDVVRARHREDSRASAIDVAWGRGDGRFDAPVAHESGAVAVRGRITSLAVADVNDDGQPDVAVFTGQEHRVDVLLGSAQGLQRRQTIRLDTHAREANPDASEGSIAVADVDGDTRLDVLVTACTGRTCDARILALPGNGDGTFRSPERHGTSRPGTGLLAAADFNQDGLVDIVVTACKTTTCRNGAFEVLLHSAVSSRTADVSSTDTMSAPPAASQAYDADAPAVSTPGAAAYNIRIVTDASPDLSDLPGLIHSTTSRWTSSFEKVWALFYWSHILKRQTAPIKLHGFEVTDPIRNLSDFGFTQCSTISGINQSLYEAIGLRHQYWDICNHTVSTVEYDGSFHMVDSSMSNLVTTDDGVTLASLTQAAADSARLVRERSLYSTSPNGFLTGSDTIRNLADFISPVSGAVVSGFARAFCANNLRFRDYYYNWNSGHRHVLNLRDDESYTRYYRRLGTTSDYWVGNASASNPSVPIELDSTNRFNLKGNGSWTFSPGLTAAAWERGVYRATNIVPTAGGLRPGIVNQTADLIYKVQAGNVIASQNIQAEFSRTDLLAAATLAVSLNHGATWVDVGNIGSSVGTAVPLTVLLRNQVNGAYEVLVRLRMRTTASAPEGVVLTRLRIDTLTQVNIKALPRFNVGRNEVVVAAGGQSDTMVLWPDLRGNLWQRDVHDFQNIASQADTVPLPYRAVAYPAVLTQDGYLTYRMEAPTDITRIVYGGRLYNYSPGSYIDYLHSFDGGATWIRSYRLSTVTKPYDVIHYETITNIPAGVRRVLFRFLMHSTATSAARASGPYALRMEASHRAPNGSLRALDVTWRWNEVRADRTLVPRSHKQRIGAFPLKYVINVGGADHPVMDSMRVSVENTSDPAPYGYSDRIDVGGNKFVHTWRTDGTNYARGRPHTMSRAPSTFQSSATGDNTTILTDGVVGAPATGGISYWWAQCWTSGSNVDLQIDLGAPRTIGALRAHLFGYPSWDALKGQVQDRVEVLTSSDNVTFASQGTLATSLWRKDVPINYMLQDDERATAWNFERALAAPVVARYVRYRATPKRNMCISELQVLDRITRAPFDVRIALPSGGTNVSVPAVVGLTQEAAMAAVTQAGLVVGAITTASSTTVPEGIVLEQSPAGGAALPPGGVVALVVSSGPPMVNGTDEIVLHVAGQAEILGRWSVVADVTAAGGARLQNLNYGAATLVTPLAAPAGAFDLTFTADAGKAYRLWLRGKALLNSSVNDSVFVQFDGSVTASGAAQWRVGTTSATTVVLQDCSGCPLQAWGWADNGFGTGVRGPLVYFAQGGPQRLRIQVREDGLGIDQVVLSAVRFMTARPGATINDTTILPATGTQ
ncbi:MAG: FG-GAP-like repeat-containing protein [Burkholderiales bacterium]